MQADGDYGQEIGLGSHHRKYNPKNPGTGVLYSDVSDVYGRELHITGVTMASGVRDQDSHFQ